MEPDRQGQKAASLARRAKVLNAVRAFFEARGYLEVETPVRIPLPLPEAHIDPVTSEGWVLQASPEACMKRLMAAGHTHLFQICKCFRRAERGRRHLPETTLLEWYAAGESYRDLMARCEELLGCIAGALGSGGRLSYQGADIDLTPPWPRLTVRDAFARYASLTVDEALAAGRFDELMGVEIEPKLGAAAPVFVCDYPAACGSLARLKTEDPAVAERFELYIGGLELCNGFSELTDPVEQRQRFAREQVRIEAAGKPPTPLPEKFLAALATMPPCAGNALGIDRLVMLFADAASIDEVVAFTPEEL
jgi:lysyl-tRNA synthetase class 2